MTAIEIMNKVDALIRELRAQVDAEKTKFKAGDRVRLVSLSHFNYVVSKIGDEAVVERIGFDGFLHTDSDKCWSILDCELVVDQPHDWRDDLKPGDWVIIRDGSKYRIQRREGKKLFVDYWHHDNGEITCIYGLLQYEDITARWEPPKCPELPGGFEMRETVLFGERTILLAFGKLETDIDGWIAFFTSHPSYMECMSVVLVDKLRAVKLWQDTWGKLV